MASDLKPEAWTISSNEALTLSLVDSSGAITFKPAFTYPIYGESEQIFGYQGLQIILAFDSMTFKPFVNIKFEKKLNDEVEDVQQLLLEKLPQDDVVVGDEQLWVDSFTAEEKSFELPAEENIVKEYKIDGESFVIYRVSLALDGIMKLAS